MTKTRITKKLVAMATTIMLLVAMLIPATAAPGTPEGKITVTKYAGTSISGALPNNTGEVQVVPAGFTVLAGAGFTLYHVDEDELQDLIDLLVPGVTVVGHVIDSTGVTPTVTWELSDGTFHTATSVEPVWGAEKVTPASGQVVFDAGVPAGAIPDGYYILVETTTPAGHASATDSLIRMPMTKQGGGDNYDIHVYPKNITSDDIANKDMGDVTEPVTAGDEMDFELKTKFKSSTVDSAADLRATAIPSADPADYGTALVRERFNKYFELVGPVTSIAVRFTNAAGDLIGAPLTNVTDYEIAYTAATATAGEIIEVKLTPAGIDKAIAANAPGFGFELRAEYTGTPTAQQGVPVNVSNTMESEIGAPGVVPPIIIEVVVIPSISINGMKHDENGNPQAGATFKLATKAVNPAPGDFVKDGNGDDLIVTTLPDGKFSFSNLPNYDNATGITYYVIETAAPAGYNGGIVVPVTWANKAWYQTNHASYFVAGDWTENINLNKDITVVNTPIGTPPPQSPGFSLPLTGGAGTLLFTAVGIIVMIGAAVVYLNGKKRNIEQ